MPITLNDIADYFESSTTHKADHRKIVKRAARKVSREIDTMKPNPSIQFSWDRENPEDI